MKTRSFVEIDVIFLQRIFRLNTIRHYQRMTNNEYKILLYQFLITQINSEGIQKLTLNNDMLTYLMVSWHFININKTFNKMKAVKTTS